MKDSNKTTMRDDPFNAIEYVNDPESRAKILKIISELPLKRRMVLLLFYYGGLGIQEVASAMNSPTWVVTGQLERARGHVLKELGMKSKESNPMPDTPRGSPVLKEILDRCAEDTATDEQVLRVLAPVIRMIEEGKFDKSFRQRVVQMMNPPRD